MSLPCTRAAYKRPGCVASDYPPRVQRILRCIESHYQWCVEYTIAHPDDKRPRSDSGTLVYSTESEAYNHVMDHLIDTGILGHGEAQCDGDDYCDKMTKTQRLHWANWRSPDVVRHTLESSKAITKMVNARFFDKEIYADSYMDMPAMQFKIAMEPFVFTCAYISSTTPPLTLEIDVARTTSDMISHIYYFHTNPGFEWTWTRVNTKGSSNNDDGSDDDDSTSLTCMDESDSEDDEDDEDTTTGTDAKKIKLQ